MHYRHRGKDLPISQVDFGTKFSRETLQCLRKNRHVTDFAFHVEKMRRKYLGMLQGATTLINNRVPPNLKVFEGLSGFCPGHVLSHFHQLLFKNLPNSIYKGIRVIKSKISKSSFFFSLGKKLSSLLDSY